MDTITPDPETMDPQFFFSKKKATFRRSIRPYDTDPEVPSGPDIFMVMRSDFDGVIVDPITYVLPGFSKDDLAQIRRMSIDVETGMKDVQFKVCKVQRRALHELVRNLRKAGWRVVKG